MGAGPGRNATVNQASSALYVCGHSTTELERLELQGAYFADVTRSLLERTGLRRGMRVVDLGCGIGDVSLLAAEIVGPSGFVIGIDRASEAIAIARARARGQTHVSFECGEIDAWSPPSLVDAVVGRFVLMHQASPAQLLRAAVRHMRPAGAVAILESHLIGSVPVVHSVPYSATYDRAIRFWLEIIARAGAHVDMGLRLHATFIEAGLPAPVLSLHARAEGGPDAAIYRYVAESVRSMMPLAERLGIDRFTPAEVDALEHQLKDEVVGLGGVLTSPMVVSAWCRLS
jgi:ubiquinone/menaquinone biosynthesis C-methylase UbiE